MFGRNIKKQKKKIKNVNYFNQDIDSMPTNHSSLKTKQH